MAAKEKTDIEFYDRKNIKNLKLPKSPYTDFIKDYIVPMIIHGSQYYIKNCDVQILLIKYDILVVPFTITEVNQCGSYIFSMQDTFINCLIEELSHIKSFNPITRSIKYLAKLFGVLFKFTRVNKTIIFNNWLFSTNPTQEIPCPILKKMIVSIKDKYPGYTILVKSLNVKTTFSTLKNYCKIGFKFMPIRPIYLLDTNSSTSLNKKNRRNIKRDKMFLEQNDLCITHDASDQKINSEYFMSLYYDLYINKHSKYNAQYTNKFFDDMLSSTCLKFTFLKNYDDIKGYAFHYCLDGVIATPLMGYSLEDRNYYRATSYAIQQYALDN